jgi:hypothetical protein
MKGQGNPPSEIGSRRRGVAWFPFGIAARLATVSASHFERLIEIQTNALRIGVSALSIQQAELSSALASRPTAAGWAQLEEENAVKGAQLIASWFHLIAQAQAAALEGVGQVFSEQYLALRRSYPLGGGLGLERRQRSVVIKFPDRRQTAT